MIKITQKYFQPYISKSTRPFWEGLIQHKLLAQQCTQCQEKFYPPQAHCPVCLSNDYEWVELSGRGTLYSWTEVHLVSSSPHIMGIIELEENIGRSIAKIEALPKNLKIGLQMQAIFIKTEGVTVLGWKPSKE